MTEGIIDTHVHIWDFDRARYAWLKDDPTILNRTYHIDELQEEHRMARIAKGVLVQAANNPEDTCMMLEVAGSTDWIKGVVGWLPLLDPERTEKVLTGQYLENKYFKGVRHLIHNEPDPKWLLQGEVVESLKILARYDLPYDIVGIFPEHIETALEIAGKIPRLKMVFDHLNQPPIAKKEKFGRWGELMKEASKNPNFYAKISGLGTATGNFTEWTPDDLTPYIEFVLRHFSEDRCFCGGDWPVSLLAGSYKKTWTAYQSILEKLMNKEAGEKVLYRNAEQFYHLQT